MESLWIPITLVCAVTIASSDALTKKALAAHGAYLIAWLRLLFALPILALAMLFVPIPALDRTFFTTLMIALPLEVIAFVLYIKALKSSPLSLSLPFLSLTPLFLIIIPYLVLGEKISLPGMAGVVLIAVGSYTLNIRDFRKGLLKPFAAIARERGSVFMIVVALIYSFTATLAKKVIEHSSPEFASLVYYAAIFLVLTPVVFRKEKDAIRNEKETKDAVRATILPGIFDAVALLTNMIALGLAKVAYMISVKRLSLLIGVFYGYLFFREHGIRERMTGAALMLAGFALIVIYH